jgi:AAA+ ATPase superfamily predicted ATPase
MFVNRLSELDLLEKHFASDKAEFFILYNRRRVAMTELMARFCEGKRAVFLSDLGSEISLRTTLSSSINAIIFGLGQMDAVYSSWEALFQALRQAVVVLDEFLYMVTNHPPLASILQKFWDQTLKNSQIMLILCGSYFGMMEKTVLGYQAPLYGRRTSHYLPEPLQFKDARLFYPSFSNENQHFLCHLGETNQLFHTL